MKHIAVAESIRNGIEESSSSESPSLSSSPISPPLEPPHSSSNLKELSKSLSPPAPPQSPALPPPSKTMIMRMTTIKMMICRYLLRPLHHMSEKKPPLLNRLAQWMTTMELSCRLWPKCPRSGAAKDQKEQQIHYQLFNDLPSKTEEAEETFEVLLESIYTKKNLGNSGQFDAMTCDCRQQWGKFTLIFLLLLDTNLFLDGNRNLACGDDSDCINRLTSIECVNSKCFCGKDCRNQRFQNANMLKLMWSRPSSRATVCEHWKHCTKYLCLRVCWRGNFWSWISQACRRLQEGWESTFYFMMLQRVNSLMPLPRVALLVSAITHATPTATLISGL